MNENILKQTLRDLLKDDFMLKEEVRGVHLLEKHSVRIDFTAKAKPHLISEGFTDEWFGIECKWVSSGSGQTSKVTRLVYQAMSYADSVFFIGNGSVRLKFVTVFTPQDLYKTNRTVDDRLVTLLSLGLYGRVGRLYFYNNNDWGIKFAKIYARSNDSLTYHINPSQLRIPQVGSV